MLNGYWRVPLFALAVLALLLGVLSGLSRFAWPLPAASLAGLHGALMVSGLFGTLISLERAVAMGRRWPYLAPAFAATATLSLSLGAVAWGAALYVAAAAVLLAGSIVLWRQQPALHLGALVLAAALWCLGNLQWLIDGHFQASLLAWQGFLILTIAGERLELSRFMPTPASARKVFGGFLLAACLGVVLRWPAVMAWACIALVGWLLRYDVLRRTIRQPGLPRYIACCLLLGYLWLMAGMLMQLAGLRDAGLHAVLLGFVFSMVFGHAPIVLPAVARIHFPYHPVLYLPLFLLHSTLLVRVVAGIAGDFSLQRWAALGNALTLLTFAGLVVGLIVRQKMARG